LLNTSDGPGGPFSFPDFCTPLGIEVLSCEGQIGLVSFVLDGTGSWSVSGTEPFDVGIGGQLAPAGVPEASSLAMLSLGLGIGIARRRRGRARTSGPAGASLVNRRSCGHPAPLAHAAPLMRAS
jgi:hypothetical protein